MDLKRTIVVLLGLAALPASAAVSLKTTLADFDAAIVGPPSVVAQDFEDPALAGMVLTGVSFDPGFITTGNLAPYVVFASGDHSLFGTSGPINARESPPTFYDLAVGPSYSAIAFDLEAWHPDSTAATIRVTLADASVTAFGLAKDPLQAEGVSVFVGLVANQPITRIQIFEPLELNGGSEEIALDNFRVAQAVPEPGTYALMAAGLLAVLVIARRRRS